MNEMLYLSRSFIEFGPFTTAEMLSFSTRAILQDSDYVRLEGSEDWLPVNDWIASVPPPPVAAPAPAPKAKKAAKKAVAKKAPAKKAPAKKAAKKSA